MSPNQVTLLASLRVPPYGSYQRTHVLTGFLLQPQPGSSPARCQPKFMVLVAGREDIQREKRLMSMLAKSVSKWAASVMTAKLCARYPPVGGGPRRQGSLSAPPRSQVSRLRVQQGNHGLWRKTMDLGPLYPLAIEP